MLRIALACLIVPVSFAHAETSFHETVIHQSKRTIDLDLDAQNVICSSADYGALHLKILIPELAGMTLLNHQNTGAGAPCVAAGPCEPGNEPVDVIDPAKPSELVDILVHAVRHDDIDHDAQTCTSYLKEAVTLTTRGKVFTHVRIANLGSRPYSDCGAASARGQPEDSGQPVDSEPPGDPGQPRDPGGASAESSPGCATSTPSGLGVLVLGGLIVRRQRRGRVFETIRPRSR